jgi:hypothetical protein
MKKASSRANDSFHRIDVTYSQTLHSYTVECQLYKELNKAMRQGNEEQLRAPEFQPFLDYIYFLSKAIAAADPLPSDVEFLYRGITKKLNKQLYQPGSTITWQAFSSTSQQLDVALTFACGDRTGPGAPLVGTLFVIVECKSARCIHTWSQYPEEAEWLYDMNTHFKVADNELQQFVARAVRKQLLGQDDSNLDIIVLAEL